MPSNGTMLQVVTCNETGLLARGQHHLRELEKETVLVMLFLFKPRAAPELLTFYSHL